MNATIVDGEGRPAGFFSDEDGAVGFQVENGDDILEQALLWVSGQPELILRSGVAAENGDLWGTEATEVKPGDEGYGFAVSDFLASYGYSLRVGE